MRDILKFKIDENLPDEIVNRLWIVEEARVRIRGI